MPNPRFVEASDVLVMDHAYAIVQLVELEGMRLVNIRNLWKKVNWNGAWSENSSLWTPELKVQLGYKPDDGTFWMSYRDFVTYFDRIILCRNNRYFEGRLPGKFLRLISGEDEEVISRWYYNLDVENQCTLTIELHQED